MPFSELMTDTICVLKQSGERFDSIKASVQKKSIVAMTSAVLIEPGDLIQRKMSNGGVETFEVIDPGFHEAFGGIPASYQMEVIKLGLPEANKAVNSITYNISGNNTRVNQNSIDISTNIINISNETAQLLEQLRSEIQAITDINIDKAEAFEIVNEIENQISSGTNNKTIIKSLLAALPAVESVTNIANGIKDLIFS